MARTEKVKGGIHNCRTTGRSKLSVESVGEQATPRRIAGSRARKAKTEKEASANPTKGKAKERMVKVKEVSAPECARSEASTIGASRVGSREGPRGATTPQRLRRLSLEFRGSQRRFEVS